MGPPMTMSTSKGSRSGTASPSSSSTVTMSTPALPRMGPNEPGCSTARCWNTRARAIGNQTLPPLRQYVEVFLDVPIGDGPDEALPLVPLVVHEYLVHVARKGLTNDGVRLESVEGLPQGRRQSLHRLSRRD